MESNHEKLGNNGPAEGDALDRTLDAELAKYAAVDPRAGIEQRILARLRYEQDRVPAQLWWRWAAVGAVAALLVTAAMVAWKWSGPAQSAVQRHLSTPIETARPSVAPVAAIKQMRPLSMHQSTNAKRYVAFQPTFVPNEPKLNQFPSPRPLSEQEKLALEYVERFPEEASLIAQAQTSLAQQEARQQESEEGRGQRNSQ